jgi:phosphatidylserine/phosphatidylglycerophosphate/cardiolipin synthase-like enzyme
VQLAFFSKSKICAIAVTIGLAACQRAEPQVVRPKLLPQDPNIQVYMNQDQASQYTEPYRKITRSGTDLEQVLIDTIVSAKSSIDVAVQEFRLPRVAKALRDRAAAGVKIRVILENTYSRPYSAYTLDDVAKLPDREKDRYQEARTLIDQNGDDQLSPSEIQQMDALMILDNAKIPRIDDTYDGSQGSGLMHHKFLVVDHKFVIVTSANFTTSDIFGDFRTESSQGNANNLLKIQSAELAQLFTQEFNFMWNRQFGVKKPYRSPQEIKVGKVTIAVQFSPSSGKIPWKDTTNGLIANVLEQATQSIDLALFVFSEQDLVNAIAPNHQQGLSIRALIEPSFAYRSYSEGLDMLGVSLSNSCKSESINRPWQSPIKTVGVPQLPPGDMLHHKFGIVDRHTVITGSHNWTPAANRGNDETLIVIRDSTVAAQFHQEFERLYSAAILGIPPAIQRKIDAHRQKCSPTDSANFNGLVNLNTASLEELETLPGVGKGMAKRIMAARPIRSWEDVDRIPGVGAKLLERVRDRVTW